MLYLKYLTRNIMLRVIFLLLLFFFLGFSEDFYLNYTQYKSCTYKPGTEKYCQMNDEPVWKSGSIRGNLSKDSVLFVFLNKKTTYRIELNTIKSDYNSDGDEIMVFTGRSGAHNYMFVAGPGYFNLIKIRQWGVYFSNSESKRKRLADSDFGTRKFSIHSMGLCFYSNQTDSYDSNCVYRNNDPRDYVLKTLYQQNKLYLYVDTLCVLNIYKVENAKNSDSSKVLLYYGKDENNNEALVGIGPDYFNVVFDYALKLSLMRDRLPGDLVTSDPEKKSWTSGSSVAIAPDILITNAHVTQNMSKMDIYLDGENVPNDGYEIVGEFSEDVLDLAIIRVKGAKLNSCALSAKEPVLGSDILVFGYPQIQYQGADLKVTKGIVSGKNGFRGDVSTFQIDAAVQHGNSGGPIVSEGKIIGLTSAVLNVEGTQNVNFGIKASKIYHLLKFHDITPKATTQDFDKCTYLLVGN